MNQTLAPPPDYEFIEKLHESARSLVFRGVRLEDHKPVIVKILNAEFPTPAQTARFRREYELTRRLGIDGIIHAEDLLIYRETRALILEDFGGESLKAIIARSRPSLARALQIGIRVANILAQLHERGIIHKDINPSNIVWNSQTGVLKLIDLGISADVSRETSGARRADQLEGTLPYIAPEQTGRMNRSLDYRVDFYSLGATLYELLTGLVPFPAADSVEIVHCHIAREPLPPAELNDEIPSVLSRIVLKLLSKAPEDRYQSAEGLAADLRRVRDELEERGRVDEFQPGQNDRLRRFQPSERSHGREAESEQILKIFQAVRRGGRGLVLLSGPAGIGKSMLAGELFAPVLAANGYFVRGKFDQVKRSVPYGPMIQAVQELVRRILTESDQNIKRWRDRITRAVGSNGRLITDVMPEVELIIGPQPEPADLPPVESLNRFNRLIRRFMRVFADRAHPLVMFFDDLQWADTSSLKMIESALRDSGVRHLLFIGAYRDQETPAAHPLRLTIEALASLRAEESPSRESGSERNAYFFADIKLAPLNPDAVRRIVAESVSAEPESVTDLARVCGEKTGNNPFYLNQFLRDIFERGLVRSTPEGVAYDIQTVSALQTTENVVDFLGERIRNLAPETRDLLMAAACAGNRFSLREIALIRGTSPGQTARALREALNEGLILPLNENYKYAEYNDADIHSAAPTDEDEADASYRFLHDRVQQAAYKLMSPDERGRLHLRIGLGLLESNEAATESEDIFELVEHLNIAASAGHAPPIGERAHARLNLSAGGRARESAAFDPAYVYLSRGIEILGDDAWSGDYELSLELYNRAAEAAYLDGRFEVMENLIDVILKNVRDPLDGLSAVETRVFGFMARNRPREALDAALPVLRNLGVRFPRNPGLGSILRAFVSSRIRLAGKGGKYFLDLPKMTDRRKQAAMRLLFAVLSPAYWTLPNLYPLLVLKMTVLSARYGNLPFSPFAYASYGLLNCGLGDIRRGYELGVMSLALADKLNAAAYTPRVQMVVETFIRHWREPARDTLENLLSAYREALEHGDLEFAGHSAMAYCYHGFFAGRRLDGLERDLGSFGDAVAGIKQETSLNIIRMFHQAILNLREGPEEPTRLQGTLYDENIMVDKHKAANDRTAVAVWHATRLSLAVWFQDAKQLPERIDLALAHMDAVLASMQVPLLLFYSAVGAYDILRDEHSTARSRVRARRIARKHARALGRFAKFAPENFAHRVALLKAEHARRKGRLEAAADAYEEAGRLARANQYRGEEVLILRRAGEFWLERGREPFAGLYLTRAYHACRHWGAAAIAQKMLSDHPRLIGGLGGEGRGPGGFERTTTRTASMSEDTLSSLDFSSVMKASQSISSEIKVDRLLTRIMKILIENAGAERGVIILNRDGEFYIEADGSIKAGEVVVMQARPLNEATDIPQTVVNYVMRTMEDVVLDDARRARRFTDDPYILRQATKSLLCTPFIHRGNIVAILYLENNLSIGAFTPGRLEVSRMLTAQAAISLDNALLYASLEEKVEERTRDLNDALGKLRERDRIMRKELAMASDIQRGLLPPREREWKGLRIISHYEPMGRVGGDFFEIMETPDERVPGGSRLTLYIADVSGHGIPAAFVAAMGKMSFLRACSRHRSPRTILDRVNEELCSMIQTPEYLTSFLFMFNSDGSALYSNGGHRPALHYHAAEHRFELLAVPGFLVGALRTPPEPYREKSLRLEVGDRLVLFTDGIVEAVNSEGEDYGENRFFSSMDRHAGLPLEEFRGAVLADFIVFTEGVPPNDDISLIVVERED